MGLRVFSLKEQYFYYGIDNDNKKTILKLWYNGNEIVGDKIC